MTAVVDQTWIADRQENIALVERINIGQRMAQGLFVSSMFPHVTSEGCYSLSKVILFFSSFVRP